MGPNGRRRKSWSRPGDEDAQAAVRELERGRDDLGLEELDLVDADHLGSLHARAQLGHGGHGDRVHPRSRVAHYLGDAVAVVDLRLEDHHALPGDLGAAQATDHLLALAAEHRAADDLEPAASAWGDPEHAAILRIGPVGASNQVCNLPSKW